MEADSVRACYTCAVPAMSCWKCRYKKFSLKTLQLRDSLQAGVQEEIFFSFCARKHELSPEKGIG